MNETEYFMVFDTETANELECPLMYNIGWVIVDRYGRIYHKDEYLCREIFFEQKELMDTCYYADRLPLYFWKLKRKYIKIASLYEIRKAMRDCCAEYNVKAIIAHNAKFDYRSTTTTQRYITKSKYRYFLPKIQLWDTLAMARQIFANDDNYTAFCESNGFMTQHNVPRPQLTAEVIYRYLTDNPTFEEKHTALSDAIIEAQIFAYCMKIDDSIDKRAFH